MRLSFVFLSLVAPASAFVPSPLCATRLWTGVASSILSEAPDSLTEEGVDPIKELLKSSAINERLEAQIQKMMEKDKTSKVLTKDVSISFVVDMQVSHVINENLQGLE